MVHRSRFHGTLVAAAGCVLALGMTPRADAGRHEGGSRGGSTPSGSVSSGRVATSPAPSRASGGHTSTPRGGTWGGGRSGSGRSGSYGGGGTYGGGHYGGSWGGYYGGHYRSYPRWYSNWYWGYTPYWASWGWMWGYPWFSDPFYSDWRYVQYYGDGAAYGGWDWRSGASWAGRFGRVKTDVEPDEAELWLNGKYVGTADDFDGYPDYLYLEPGSYHLEFRLAGHQAWSTDVTVRRGEVRKLDHELARESGRGKLDSFYPEKKGMPSGRFFTRGGEPVSPQARRNRDRDRSRDDDRPMGIDDRRPRTDVQGTMDDDEDEDQDVAPPPPTTRGRDSDRDRDREREGSRDRDRVERRAPDTDTRARLRWKVTPDDAAIWVDDQYLGTAEELLARPRGTTLAPGHHTVTVVRPGYKSRTVEVDAKGGEAVDVVVELEK